MRTLITYLVIALMSLPVIAQRDEREGKQFPEKDRSAIDNKDQDNKPDKVVETLPENLHCSASVSNTLPGGGSEKGTKTIFYKCKTGSSDPVKMSVALNYSIPRCSNVSPEDKFCVKEIGNQSSVTLSGNSLIYIGTYISLKSVSLDKIEIPEKSITLQLGKGATTKDFPNEKFLLQDAVKIPACSIVVSGAERGQINEEARCSGPGCTPTKTQTVENGELVFQVISSTGDPYLSVDWEGGPRPNGVWKSPETQKDHIVRAKVTFVKGQKPVECAIKINQLGESYSLNINRYGSCPLFRDMRNYYFLNKDNSEVQTTGYSKPLKIPGVEVEYAKSEPDIPFTGILNGAASTDGEIYKNTEGQVIIPPVNLRDYSSAVVVVRKYSKTEGNDKIEEPSFYGLLNYSDYSNTRLRPIGTPQLTDEDLVVLQIFLAHKEIDAKGNDIRGAEGLPWYKFTASDVKGKPFDKLVPLAEDSCIDLFQIKPPKRPDGKKFPRSISDSKMCLFSKPFTFGEVKQGRAKIKAIDTMPMFSSHLYPLDLISGNAGAPVSEDVNKGDVEEVCDPESKDLVECWNISPSDLAATSTPTWVSGGKVETKLAKSKVVRERTPGDECSTREKTINEYVNSGSGPSMGVRYSSAAMSFGAAFACAVNFDLAGVPVGSNLQDSTAWSGDFSGPPALSATCPNAYQAVACCTHNTGIWNTVKAFGLNVPHAHHFTKSKAPKSCVKRTNFRVQPWGYQGGAAVAAFSAVLCPGSQYSYTNVALSWSPLIIDVAGNGIHISRKFESSVRFDIKGTKTTSYVDWPINVNDVAFLVLPDKEGKVTSIKQLFGEHGKFKNGFDALAIHDIDKNEVIDERDSVYKKLRLWFDRNRNGVAEPDELASLFAYGVESIYVNYSKPGVGRSAERKTLNSVYFNNEQRKFMNIEDHYFYEYVDGRRVTKSKK